MSDQALTNSLAPCLSGTPGRLSEVNQPLSRVQTMWARARAVVVRAGTPDYDADDIVQ